MGQKTNPIGNRLGIVRGWESNWYAKKHVFADNLVEDTRIRAFLVQNLQRAGVSKVVIERTLARLTITIHTSKPGFIIGKGGEEVDKLKARICKMTGKDGVQINIQEVRKAYLDAKLVADDIARKIENRVNYKRAVRMTIEEVMRSGADGIKIKIGGRLGGAEIARSEEIKRGSVPLHTYRMDIDYASEFAFTSYGKIGIKVWICRGEVLHKRNLDMNFVGTPFAGGSREGKFSYYSANWKERKGARKNQG